MSLSDSLKDAFFALVRGALPLIDFYKFYRATVVSQSGDGRLLDLKPDNPIVPGHQKVPLRLGLPGARVKFSPGAKVLLGWEDGDPKQPVAAMFGGGEGVTSISIETDLLELGAEGLTPVQDGAVTGQGKDPYTGMPYWMLGNSSAVVRVKK